MHEMVGKHLMSDRYFKLCDRTWKHLLKLTEKAQFPIVVQEGYWIWMYDNLNFQKKIRHEHLGDNEYILFK